MITRSARRPALVTSSLIGAEGRQSAANEEEALVMTLSHDSEDLIQSEGVRWIYNAVSTVINTIQQTLVGSGRGPLPPA
ncbi:hypothetical protein PBY51_021928 [Eleginops maclovinus]|uniref:Uncharacterized protein n=1 Tax=Eleginops maclovinus TaxID=56733 RepID=A0AAN8AMM3_ELEMC|nr:hypothetical protein PBY51_021928 [Eleginops maclovinus]